jgi:hypothetical protein
MDKISVFWVHLHKKTGLLEKKMIFFIVYSIKTWTISKKYLKS